MTEELVQNRTRSSARLHIVLGDSAVDVTVPAEVPLVDVLPAVLPHFGDEVIERSAEHEGWVLQRLGEASLDIDGTPTDLGLHDGDTLYLRPRADHLEPVAYDDVVAGLGEQVRRHPGAWTPARTRVMLLVGATVLLLLGVPVLALGAMGLPGVVAAVLIVVLALGASGMTARGGGRPTMATVLAGVAAAYAAAGGTLLAETVAPGAPMVALTCASAAAAIVLAVGQLLVADAALLFTGALTATVSVAVAGFLGSVTPLSPMQASAIVVVLTILASLFVPAAAFRLAGLSLPLLPSAAEELGEDITPVPHQLVVERGAATVGYTGALGVGFGVAQVVLLAPAASSGGWALVFALVVTLLLVLRARHYGGMVARWAGLVPAGLVLAVAVVGLSAAMPGPERLLVLWLPVVAVGVLLLTLVEVMPGRRLRPYWGRAVDILESLTAVAVVPALLQMLRVYATMRGLGG